MMLLRNKKLIPHDASRGKSRHPVVCEGDIKMHHRDMQHLQAIAESRITVNQGGPDDVASNFDSLGLASPQESTALSTSSSSSSSITSLVLVSPSSSSHSSLSSTYERKCRVIACKKIRGNTRCQTCSYLSDCKTVFTSTTLTKRTYKVINRDSEFLSCTSANIVYLLSCRRCKIQYVGETQNSLNKRMNTHRTTIFHKENGLIAQHFNNGSCTIEDLCVQLEQIHGNEKEWYF